MVCCYLFCLRTPLPNALQKDSLTSIPLEKQTALDQNAPLNPGEKSAVHAAAAKGCCLWAMWRKWIIKLPDIVWKKNGSPEGFFYSVDACFSLRTLELRWNECLICRCLLKHSLFPSSVPYRTGRFETFGFLLYILEEIVWNVKLNGYWTIMSSQISIDCVTIAMNVLRMSSQSSLTDWTLVTK